MDQVVRFRYVALTVAVALATLAQMRLPFNDDWPLFVWGSQLLFGDHPSWATSPGGVHIFANYHVQIGPLTLVVVTPLRLLGLKASRIAAMVVMAAFGPILVSVLERASARVHGASDDRRRREYAVLVGGIPVMVAWGAIVNVLHLDDALTLLFVSCALLAIAANRPRLAGALLGLGVASKLWGVVLIPLVLAFKGRDRLRAVVALCVSTATWWLPFLLGDRGTLTAFRGANVPGVELNGGRIAVFGNSLFGLFGLANQLSPSWARPVQITVAIGIGVAAALAGRWPAVGLIGITTRVALDPLVFRYYCAGLVVAAFAWELLRTRRPTPVLTYLLLGLSYFATDPGGDERRQALVLLLACGISLVLSLGLHTDPVGDASGGGVTG